MIKIAVLIDEKDRQLGKVTVGPACKIIQHAGLLFVRTEEIIPLGRSRIARAIAFRQSDPWHRNELEPI